MRADQDSGKTTRAMLRCSQVMPAEPPLPAFAPIVRATALEAEQAAGRRIPGLASVSASPNNRR